MASLASRVRLAVIALAGAVAHRFVSGVVGGLGGGHFCIGGFRHGGVV